MTTSLSPDADMAVAKLCEMVREAIMSLHDDDNDKLTCLLDLFQQPNAKKHLPAVCLHFKISRTKINENGNSVRKSSQTLRQELQEEIQRRAKSTLTDHGNHHGAAVDTESQQRISSTAAKSKMRKPQVNDEEHEANLENAIRLVHKAQELVDAGDDKSIQTALDRIFQSSSMQVLLALCQMESITLVRKKSKGHSVRKTQELLRAELEQKIRSIPKAKDI